MEKEQNQIINGFVHLHNHTEYSLLDGSARIRDMVARAKALGMPALAITDHGSMYGVIDFYKEACKHGIKPIIGCEVYVAPRSRFEKTVGGDGEAYYHLVLLAKNMQGYRNLVKLVSKGYTEGFYYKPRVDKEILREYSEGIIALSACLAGEVPAALLRGEIDLAYNIAQEYSDIFGAENFYIEVQDHGIDEQKRVNPLLIELAGKLQLGMVVTNDIHYVRREDSISHDALLCIQTGKTVSDEKRMRFSGNEFYLKSAQEMADLFPQIPETVSNTLKIAEQCQVEFEFGVLHLPEFPVPAGTSDDEYLRKLCYEKLGERYKIVTEEVTARLDYELGVIRSMGYSGYFLIVWDFVKYAHDEKIAVGPGRGSAAGSIVAYILEITNIDPLEHGLLFERFLNPERISMPDIDIDFCYEKRNQIIEYVSKQYGADHVAQITTFGTMAAKAAIRDVGRVLGMSYSDVDRVAKLVPSELGITLTKALENERELKKLYNDDESVQKLIDLAMALEGLPRHASIHAAGLVIGKFPLDHYVPLQNSSEGFLITQFDKDRVEEIGLLKMDILGLRTLTVISDAVEMIRVNHGVEININDIPLTDEKVAAMLAYGDTAGVFQLESSGITSLVRDLKPEGFKDIIPLVALYRPGPLGSGMVADFVDRRHGKKQSTYLHPILEPILQDTFGVVLYQEQVMQIASTMGGFTLGEADLLRRAMGKKKHDVLVGQRERFVKGALERDIDEKIASEIFDLLVHFADYGFNKSHSAAYAMVAYQTAWLKANYREEFFAAILTNNMKVSEKISFYIEECRRIGIKVLPPDVNVSGANFSAENNSIRFGLSGIRTAGENSINNIVEARAKGGKFTSLTDFCQRVDMKAVNRRLIENMIKCGAFDSFGKKRSQLLAVVETAMSIAGNEQKAQAHGLISLFGEETLQSMDVEYPQINELAQEEILSMEKEIIGFYVTGHPLDKFRTRMATMDTIDKLKTEGGEDNGMLRVGGLIVSAKRLNTKNGDTMCFVELEDFSDKIEVVVFPRVFLRYSSILTPDRAICVSGRLSVNEEEIKILAQDIKLLEELADEVRITVNKRNETNEVMMRLKEVFSRHRGKTTVYLQLTGSNRTIKTEEEFWVTPSNELKTSLEAIVGKGMVSL